MSRRRFQRGQLTREGTGWVARWREDVLLPNGETIRKRRKERLGTIEDYPTKRLAQRALDDRLRDVNSTEYRPTSQITFQAFAKRWLDTVAVQHKPSTQRSEKSVINCQLVPVFGAMSFPQIQAEGLQRYVSMRGGSPNTVRLAVRIMKGMWKTAKAWGYASHNPFEGLKLPRAVKANTYNFTLEETLAIIEKAEEPWKTIFRILAETGMRPGELAGLRISDIDWQLCALSIKQSVWMSSIQTPKTDSSIRTFPISQSLRDALKVVISRPNKHGLVFTEDDGSPLVMENFRPRVLKPILEELGIRAKLDALGITRCGNYAFRHMNATIMDQKGVPLATRQARLGHAPGSEITLGHYTHPIENEDREFADYIGALLSPKGNEAIQ